ncbi:MAG: hypothetical protein OQK49_08075 [Proteobacteria bacterium]|nr:hypothetical protein [Pseudomonadota bacterium]
MLLRRITQHIQNQNWFAVFIAFLIVVVGVFIGIQVANWNDEREDFEKETLALVELKKELSNSIAYTKAKAYAYQQAADAGRRSLAYLDDNTECIEDCWDRLVDFMHASQWQSLTMSTSTYRNMRNQGYPRNTTIIDAVDEYLAQNQTNSSAFTELPYYRSRVRQIVSLNAQDYYWEHCWKLSKGIETYFLNCPQGINNEQAKKIVDKIIHDHEITYHLTEWIGNIVSLPYTLEDQNTAASRAIDSINQELEVR